MLEYIGENHGLARRPNQLDYTVRMKEFFDHYLKGRRRRLDDRRRSAPEDGRAPEGAQQEDGAGAEEDHDGPSQRRAVRR